MFTAPRYKKKTNRNYQRRRKSKELEKKKKHTQTVFSSAIAPLLFQNRFVKRKFRTTLGEEDRIDSAKREHIKHSRVRSNNNNDGGGGSGGHTQKSTQSGIIRAHCKWSIVVA